MTEITRGFVANIEFADGAIVKMFNCVSLQPCAAGEALDDANRMLKQRVDQASRNKNYPGFYARWASGRVHSLDYVVTRDDGVVLRYAKVIVSN